MNETVFSPIELKVLKFLGKKTIKVTELNKLYFKDEEVPFNPGGVITAAILRINKKCKFYELTWYIGSTGLGRGGKFVWIEKLK